MFSKMVSILTLGMSLSSCFKLPLSSTAKLDQASSLGATVQAVSTDVGSTKAIATIDPDSKSATQLKAPRVQGLLGASVIIPPGSLGIAADIVVEQAADFGETSMTTEMGLAADIQVASASPGMIIRPTENVDLKKPLSLAMPLPSGVGLRLADAGSKYAIFYKYFDPTEARLLMGFKVVDGVNVKMVFDEKSGHDVLQFEGYFGAYWATTLSREVKPSEVPPAKPAEAPIVNKANVSVIETRGIVKETEILKTQAIPELVWTKPSIKFAAQTRSVFVSIPVPTGRTVNACKIDLYESSTMPDGVSLEAPLGTTIEYAVAKITEHSLVGRFRCFDDQGRTSVTPWSDAVFIPALLVQAPALANVDFCADVQASLEARPYGVAFSGNMPLLAAGKCHYAGNLFMDSVQSFYIARSDSSLVCGLPTHTLIEGTQKLQCVKASGANIGGDFLSIARGNYSYDIDFSQSVLEPSITITRLPCSLGDMHILSNDSYTISPAVPTFTEPSAANKMTHIGACEFVYETSTSPTSSYEGKVMFANAGKSLFCGDTPLGQYSMGEFSNYDYTNTCSSIPRFFKMPLVEAGITSYVFSLRLGASAKEHNSSANDIARFNRTSNCPDQLYLYSNLMGQSPLRDGNDAQKRGACRYEWLYAADVPAADLAFKIGDEMKTKLCGPAIAGASDYSPDIACGSTVYPMIPNVIERGKVYRVSAVGDGLTGNMTSISISPLSGYESSCEGGLYTSPSIANGYFNAAASGFVERSECVFERDWTPTVANDGFYVHSGRMQKVCASDGSPDRQATVDGSETKFYCRGNANEFSALSAIRPLNATVGTSYRVVADMRFPYQLRMKVLQNTGPSCADDVYMNGTPAGSVKMQSRGHCNYSYDLTLGPNASTSMNYSFTMGGTTCNSPGVSPNLNYAGRSSALVCGSGVPFQTYAMINGHTYRWSLSRDPTTANGGITVQDITRDLPADRFSGAAGTELGYPYFRGAFIVGPSPPFSNVYEWTVGTATSFLLEKAYGATSFCALAPNAPAALPYNSPIDMICNLGTAALAGARSFQNGWTSGQKLRVEMIPGGTIEGPMQLKITMNNPLGYAALAFLKGSQDLGAAAVGTLGTFFSSVTPEALSNGTTWTDASGNLWLYGGEGISGLRGELWKFDGVNWGLMFGDYTTASQPTVPGTRPGARRGAASWVIGSRLYLFGGYGVGYAAGPVIGNLNDLWYYDTTSNAWTYVSGPVSAYAAGNAGAYGVEAAGYLPGAREGVTTWMNASGEVFLFGGMSNSLRLNDTWHWNPTTGYWSLISGLVDSPSADSNLPSPRAYASHWYLSGGNSLYLFGGYTGGGCGASGEMWQFSSGSWIRKKGDDSLCQARTIVQDGIFSPLNTPGQAYTYSMASSQSWILPSGHMFLFSEGTLWAYDGATNQWAAFLMDNQRANIYETQPWPVYTTVATASYQNQLGLRHGGNVWVKGGQMFLWGGYSRNGMGSFGYRNDLWEIVPPTY